MDTESSPSGTLTQPAIRPSPSDGTSAYLIVHAEPPEHGRRGRHGLTPLQRLRARYWTGSAPSIQPTLSLTLTDRHGRTVMSLTDADPVLGIALLPGTYHLTATRGDSQRGYTVSLPAGSRFDLHLRFSASERPSQAAPMAVWPARSLS